MNIKEMSTRRLVSELIYQAQNFNYDKAANEVIFRLEAAEKVMTDNDNMRQILGAVLTEQKVD